MLWHALQGIFRSMKTAQTSGPTLAHRLADRLVRRLRSPDLPQLGQVAAWLDLVEICRELDHWLAITENPDPSDAALHRAVLALAIGAGEWLRFEFEQSPIDLSPLGVDAAVLNASLQMLSDSFVLWHSDLTSERREEIVREVFGVAA